MTFEELKKAIDKHNIPYNVTLESDSGWEHGPIPGVEENKKSIEENLKKIQENQQIIQENQKRISENKEEIEKLREEYRWLSESSQARLERINKRLVIIIMLLLGILIGTNAAWIIGGYV